MDARRPPAPVTIQLRVDRATDFRSLHTWLRRVRGVSVDAVSASPGPGEQGGGWEMLSVAFGSGGAGIAMLGTIRAWVESRQSTVRIRVNGTGPYRDVELDATNVLDVMPLLEKMLDGSS